MFVERIIFGLVVVSFIITIDVVGIVTGAVAEVTGTPVTGNEAVAVVTWPVVLVFRLIIVVV